MAKQMDLLRDRPSSLYFRYLVPSVSASLVTSIYILADTIMIGRGCGAEALAALNLVLPVFAVLFASGTLFGVGGGVLYSVARGNGDDERAQGIWSTAVLMVVGVALLLMLTGALAFRPLCYALGADESNIQMVMDYAQFIVYGAPFFVLSYFLQAFVRNDQDPKRAMAGVLSGAAVNIILDYVFIFPMQLGLTGGAAATLLGNIVTVLVVLTHLRSPRNRLYFSRKSIRLRLAGEIFLSGAPSFFIEAASGLITFTFNRQLLRYLGHAGVVAYGVVANYALVMQSLFNGVGQAAQPVMATNYGAGQRPRVHRVRLMGLVTVVILACVAVLCAYTFPEMMTALFVEPTEALLALSVPALHTYFPAFLPFGLNLFLTTYLQSIVRAAPALAIMVLRGVILPVLFAIVLPGLFGGFAIFAAVLCAEGITSLLSIGLSVYHARHGG